MRRFFVATISLSLALGACSDATETAEFGPIAVMADESRTSPLPDAGSGDTAVGESVTYEPLDLGFLGHGAAASAVPGAIPEGIEVGFTEEGYPYRGAADAPVTLVEYSDYACPFCGRYTSVNVPELLTRYGVSGEVRFVFREFPLTSIHPTAPQAHVAAYCTGEQSAALYWEMHDALFAGQADWTQLGDPADVIRTMAEGLGADTSTFDECVESGRGDAVVEAGVADALALGFNGTPSFQVFADDVEGTFDIIGAQAVNVFEAYIDSLLAGQAPSDPRPEPGDEPDNLLPIWADVETGLQPDADRPGVNVAGDFYKGDPQAPVVVIEFSDFQCPFCRQHALEVQPTIDERFVETGDVLWVYKHLPLPIHPLAPTAGAAAECAGDQGRFFEMHELLFETSDRWQQGDTEAEIVALAGGLGLDVAAFESCFNSREALERVLADLADVGGIIDETPSFVFVAGDRASLQRGSLPVDRFIANLEAVLEQAADVPADE